MSERLYGDAKATARVADSNRKQKALEDAEMKVRQDPSVRSHMKLVNALFDLGRFEDAEREVNMLLSAYGEDLQALTDLGFIYKNLGRRDEAMKTFQRVVALEPRHALARCAENEIFAIDPSIKPSWMRRD